MAFHVQQEGPLNALALNKDNTQVAIGGRNVFKVYAIDDDKFREVINLRASKNLNHGFSCNDVAWSWTDEHYLATAATNGHVCVWNLTKIGKAMQEQDYQEHKRTVNKVNFHSSEPSKLISGSQDGTMRYFDIRTRNAVAIFYSNTESVRDVQFSPHNPYTFAAVSENGSVQLWDVRRPDRFQQQFAAHSGPIFACDWHPDSTWLATASRDKTIKVWDLTSKLTLEYTIHTIASIGHVKWRPQRKYHIASCALVVDCSINIWDVRRPYIPFAAFNEHKDIPSGVAWKEDPDTFLSTGRDSTLYHHSFDFASRPASKANPQGVSLNKNGEILYAHKINVNISAAKAPMGIMRKTSVTQSPDQFHLASSFMQQFTLTPRFCGKTDSEVFIGLANNYILSGQTLSEMCDHNALIAKQFGQNQLYDVWKVIKTMYGEEFFQNHRNSREETVSHANLPLGGMDIPSENEQKSKGGDTPAAQVSDETENEDQVDHIAVYNNGFPTYLNMKTGLPKGDFSFGENEIDIDLDIMPEYQSGFRNYVMPQQDFILPNEAFHLRHEIRNRTPPSDKFSNTTNFPILNDSQALEEPPQKLLTVSSIPKIPFFDPSCIVLDALKHHANLGDVQTSVSILIVLGDQRKRLKDLDESTQEHWLLGYIELLSRYQLWNISTEIIKLSWISSVEQLNQQSTRFNTNCSSCSKALQRIGWLCDRCHSSQYALCSICHQVVKGLYAWCQGCSHGGHLAHMKQWFAINKMCPTGCRHICEYK